MLSMANPNRRACSSTIVGGSPDGVKDEKAGEVKGVGEKVKEVFQ
jgi:hypothetical protein